RNSVESRGACAECKQRGRVNGLRGCCLCKAECAWRQVCRPQSHNLSPSLTYLQLPWESSSHWELLFPGNWCFRSQKKLSWRRGIHDLLNLMQHLTFDMLTPQLILGSWLNMLGALLRFLGTLPMDAYKLQFPAVMLGQTLGALAQPLIIFTPTKLAALWFPDCQRATANMIASMCNRPLHST
ncbi:hypothetical protein GOODEAATRI_019869, partial [Goodea atripinnis]